MGWNGGRDEIMGCRGKRSKWEKGKRELNGFNIIDF